MGVGGQSHAPAALPPGKTRYPLYKRLGGPQGLSGQVGRDGGGNLETSSFFKPLSLVKQVALGVWSERWLPRQFGKRDSQALPLLWVFWKNGIQTLFRHADWYFKTKQVHLCKPREHMYISSRYYTSPFSMYLEKIFPPAKNFCGFAWDEFVISTVRERKPRHTEQFWGFQ